MPQELHRAKELSRISIKVKDRHQFGARLHVEYIAQNEISFFLVFLYCLFHSLAHQG